MSKQTVNRFQTPQALVTIDAVTCAATGILFLLWSQPIAQWTALPAGLLFWAGVILMPIALFMAITGRAARPRTWALSVIVLGNILWVVASIALPVTGLVTPNSLGWLLLLAQAGVVAALTVLEMRLGLGRDEPALPTAI